jgi:hypothetical protein
VFHFSEMSKSMLAKVIAEAFFSMIFMFIINNYYFLLQLVKIRLESNSQ